MHGGRQGAPQLTVHHRFRPPGLPFGELFADAQDRPQPGVPRPVELAGDDLVRLAVIAAPLGVADDHPRREAHEHRGAHLAGVRSRQLVMDVLGTDGDPRPGERVADIGERRRTAGR